MGFLQATIFAAITSILIRETIGGHVINFPSFDVNTDIGNFSMVNNATISSGALQVTPDTRNKDPFFSLKNRSGRVILKKKFRVYHGKDTASFSTSFVFNIQGQDGIGGEGLAFIVSSFSYNSHNMLTNSSGQWLGLFNASTNGNNSSKVVAVEFDTRQSPGTNDPDGNHVGINVNSINSINLTSLHNQINLTGGDIRAWIQYNGYTKKLDVYLANKSEDRPLRPLVSSIIDLSNGTLDSEAYFGFSASTGEGTELNCVKAWTFTIEPVSLPNHKAIVIAVSVSCLIFALVAATGIIVLCKYLAEAPINIVEEAPINIVEALQSIPGRPREFGYKDLRKATNNFNPAALLGRGGFGSVYKGVFQKEKTVVAVKCMAKDCKRGKAEFISEISVINRLRHRNLVPLLGWCHEKGQLIMVYECMPNGSLEKHIFKKENSAGRFLDWDQRYNIVSGVASALLYLHEECEQQVIHRDVKASNIMLDSEYNARLGDFGLARLIEHNRRSFTATGVVGTLGYIAPESFHTGRATAESDVFSFGAVALEVTCGRPPTFSSPEAPDLVGWVWNLYSENEILEAADSRLAKFGSVNINENDVRRLLMLGLACSNPNPDARPTMREVTQVLARNMPPPYVPPVRPEFVWSHLPSDLSFTSTFTTNSIHSTIEVQ